MPSLQLVAVLGSALPVVWPRRSRASLVPSRPASGEWMSVNIAPSSGTERSIREVQLDFVAADARLSFSVPTVMASAILRPPSAGSERRVDRHGRSVPDSVSQPPPLLPALACS